jgi:hypothetical protein
MSMIDKAEKKILIVTGLLLGLFVFSMIYARDKYSSDVPECLPYDKAYTEPKVESSMIRPTRSLPWRRCGVSSHPRSTFQ